MNLDISLPTVLYNNNFVTNTVPHLRRTSQPHHSAFSTPITTTAVRYTMYENKLSLTLIAAKMEGSQ